MSHSLYVVRDKTSGHFINELPAGHGHDLFVPDIAHAFVWRDRSVANNLSISLSHGGRTCEVVEIEPTEGVES
ncbi:hypothetical protein [Methyloradius palustris]|uniref:Uncharacterized protein n=1 Tax=Methyloradius palustris TaxID=2778876 RepID=A0A8D5FY14_9PROT|nr:hypothetical protein [Methyloradius palustris]BCM23825.1 hypothetical protein ZMTM_00840 [Methyloradius palustris]